MDKTDNGKWLGQHSSPVTEKWWDFSTAPQNKKTAESSVPDMEAFRKPQQGRPMK